MKCYCCRVTLTLYFNQLLACWPCKSLLIKPLPLASASNALVETSNAKMLTQCSDSRWTDTELRTPTIKWIISPSFVGRSVIAARPTIQFSFGYLCLWCRNDISFQSYMVRARTWSHRLSRINPAEAFFTRSAFPNIFMAIANIDASSKLSCLLVSVPLVMSFIGNQASLEPTTISAINSELNLPWKYWFISFVFFFTVPTTPAFSVVGASAELACDVNPPTSEDRILLVLWYREGLGKPIYR